MELDNFFNIVGHGILFGAEIPDETVVLEATKLLGKPIECKNTTVFIFNKELPEEFGPILSRYFGNRCFEVFHKVPNQQMKEVVDLLWPPFHQEGHDNESDGFISRSSTAL